MSAADPQFAPSGHLGGQVSAYADRSLPAQVQLAYDRHVVVCIACRAIADDERRLLASLRAAPIPGPTSSLQATLRGLGSLAPPIAVAAAAAGRRQLVVLPRTAPPMHRSPVRAALVAGLAAGASAAAAWSLGVVGVSAGTVATQLVVPSTSPAVTSGGSTSAGSVAGGPPSPHAHAGLDVSHVPALSPTPGSTVGQVGVLGPRAGVTVDALVQAQSTP